MKKPIIFLFALLAVASTSCRKEDATITGSKANYWRVAGKVYQVDHARTIVPSQYHRMLTAGEAADTTASNVNFYFPELPSQSGYYRVTRNVISGMSSDEMSVMTTTYLNGKYEFHYSTGSEGAVAYVTVAGGKISVSMPEVWVVNRTGLDSFKVSASVTQTE